MVRSYGNGRMEVMARLLADETFSQNVPDDFTPQMSAAEYICRELRDADEANLLHGEDMQLYGERPMTDMLQLVCCNVCKKPIKDSQYAAHAELCRSSMLTEPTSLELNCSTGNRKSARKAKKKLYTSCANQATEVGDRRMSDTVDNIDIVVSKSHLNSQIRVTSFSFEAKGHSTFVDAAFMMDETRIIPGNRDHPASIMHPPTESHKVITSRHLSLPESHRTKSGVTKFVNFTDGITRNNLLEGTVSEHGCPNHKNIGPVHEQHVTNNDYPAPLATKIYYSQRNNRLRAAIRHLYFQELSEDMCNDAVSPNASHGEKVAFQDPCQKDPSFDQIDNVINKSHLPTLCSAQNSGHILAKSSEVCLLKAGALPSGGLSNQFLVDNVSRSAATHVGLMRSNFLPKSYAFANNSGNPLGTMQQPNGSVPVI
ncbi:hypothetical protein Lalb_Chr18g0055751 [Lupinus albus]|uniref:SAGA-associated factor 11 n=1 Tax=Lupinus albus TaxID=3870 RepID=A0A6A4NZ46_LUPAL|nr:hypothetical protein Lalb_Chr18g0055751 [Lupinus albus]